MAKGKAGRSMNPADKERKKQRAQELKRNKKQRTIVRTAIVKGRDPEELLDQLRKLDNQEFDPNCELSKHVIVEKRHKLKGAFIQQLSLYRTEQNNSQVIRLENLLAEYEEDRIRKEKQYQAVLFSQETNLGDIPLPDGFSVPNAALTPYMPPPPVAPQFKSTRATTRSSGEEVEGKKTPPGPPCGPPVDFDADIDVNRSRRFQPIDRFAHALPDYDVDDDDLGPVAMPDHLLPPKSAFQPVRTMISAPPIAPQFAPPPPPPVPRFDQQRRAPPIPAFSQSPTKPADAVISAEPQMRNLTKEATRFMPTALQVTRPSTSKPKAPLPSSTIPANRPAVKSEAPKGGMSADDKCDEFLREIQDLF
ncbi:hypothetical protein M3Y99_01464400 [Aphelenchoides fujianensis]|nr:hypothetical protein M3Y99_01464400 [Aphelenchoides fujianensis]